MGELTTSHWFSSSLLAHASFAKISPCILFPGEDPPSSSPRTKSQAVPSHPVKLTEISGISCSPALCNSLLPLLSDSNYNINFVFKLSCA